ncbi:elongation factor P [Candidatus Kaiserbacteria bacterium]|nr:elongation factor P [Candidatus Kaiserbacteria bacterium]
MAILSYSDVVPKKIITFDGGIYEVISSHVARKDMGKPSNRTKLRNLKTGKVSEVVFHQAERVEEADVEEREVKFIYKNRGEVWFSDPNNPKDRFPIKEEVIGDAVKFLKPDMLVDMRKWEDELLGVHLPIKMEFKVTEAPPAVKGNTAQGGTKIVTLEGGATVNAPLFINEGDTVRINTDTGEYVERVEKA